MIEQKVPIFTDMRFLKNEILRALRDFPKDITEVFTTPYSDGVVTGLNLAVTDQVIKVTPGMVKVEGRLLLLKEGVDIPYQPRGQRQALKLIFEEPYKNLDFEGQQGTISLEDNIECQSNEMELARFKLEEGAYLRSDYQDLLDFSTGYNTLNLVHQPYSGLGESTIHPAILKYFARELLGYRTENPSDMAICYQMLSQSGSLSKETLNAYFQMRLQIETIAENNVEIHEKLVQILSKAKQEQRHVARPRMGNRKLIVD